MAILKYYNPSTSAWEYIAASPTANFTTWKKTATGGETSLSGTDDNAVTLSYTPGLEQVFLNGVLLIRGTDYTAITGTSITGLSALTASDIVSIVCYAPFNVGDAVPQTLMDAKGDLVAGTADNTAGRLAVGTNNAVLTAASGETTGLKWNVPNSFELINSGGTTLTGAGTITVNVSGKSKYLISIEGASSASVSSFLGIRFNSDSGSNYNYVGLFREGTGSYNRQGTDSQIIMGRMGSNSAGNQFSGNLIVFGANSSEIKPFTGTGFGDGTDSRGYNVTGFYTGTSAISSISVVSGTGNFDLGTIFIYGAI